MNLFTITILAALLYIAYRIAGKFSEQKTDSEIFLEELKTKKETSKKKKDPLTEKVKEKIITQITESGEYSAPIKPKRKYNKKPKA
jgi:hypothetical protein